MSSSFFIYACIFLVSNTVIMFLMFMLLKAMTNNQPQVWISDLKLLVFLGFTLLSSQVFTKMCIFSLCNFISLYLMINYFHWLIMLIVTINYLLTYLLHVTLLANLSIVAHKMAVFLFCFYFSRLSLVSAPAFGNWNVASSQQCHQEGEAASGMRQNSPCFMIVASFTYGSDHDTNVLLLWARHPGASPYRSTTAFSSRNVLIAILLL